MALIYGAQSWTYEQLQRDVELMGPRLLACGLHQDAVAALWFKNAATQLIVSIALLRIGVTQVSIPSAEPPLAQQQLLQEYGATALLTDQSEALGEEGLLRIECQPDQCVAVHVPTQALQAPAELRGLALLIKGSGTTGAPKIMPVHRALLRHLLERDNAFRAMDIGDRHYSFSSIDYYTAKRRSWACLMRGVCVVLVESPPQRIVEFCRQHDVQHLSLTTHQAVRLLLQEHVFDEPVPRLPQLKSLVASSSPVSDAVRDELERVITPHTYIAYGCNEFGEATCTPPGGHRVHPGTVGLPCPGVRISILNEAGEPLPPGEVGYVCLDADETMHGYVQHPQASAETFKAAGCLPGDLGRIDEDGYLIYLGRADDLMILQGVNVYPREIEQVLEAHPQVHEAAAFPLTDGNALEIPVAVVRATQLSEQELHDWCTQQLGWRRPARILFSAQELPKNVSGKVLKRELAQTVLELLQQERAAAASS